MNVFSLVFAFYMILYIIKDFEQAYDKACDAALKSIQGTFLHSIYAL